MGRPRAAIFRPARPPGSSGSMRTCRLRPAVRGFRFRPDPRLSDQRPRIGPARGGLGGPALVSQAARALGERANLRARAHLLEARHPALAGGELVREALRIAAQLRRNFLVREFPDDRSELWEGVERQTIVDAPDVTVAVEQAMAALAVRVIDDEVERRHRAEVSGSRGDQREEMLRGAGTNKCVR